MAEVGISLAVGLAVRALMGLFAPKKQQTKLPDIDQPKASYGAAIPTSLGRNRLGTNLVWTTGIKRKKKRSRRGKGGGSKSEQKTFSSFMVLICQSLDGAMSGVNTLPVLEKVWLGSTLYYDSSQGNSKLNQNALKYMTFYPGSRSENQNPLMAITNGASKTPHYRGYSYLIFNELPLEDEKVSYGGNIPTIEVQLNQQVLLNGNPEQNPYMGILQYLSAKSGVPFRYSPNGYFNDNRFNLNSGLYGIVFPQDGKQLREYADLLMLLTRCTIASKAFNLGIFDLPEPSYLFCQDLNKTPALTITNHDLGWSSEEGGAKLLYEVEATDPNELPSGVTINYRVLGDEKNGEVSYYVPSRHRIIGQIAGEDGTIQGDDYGGFGDLEQLTVDITCSLEFARDLAAYLAQQKTQYKDLVSLKVDVASIQGLSCGDRVTLQLDTTFGEYDIFEYTILADQTVELKLAPAGSETVNVSNVSTPTISYPVPQDSADIIVKPVNCRVFSTTIIRGTPLIFPISSSDINYGVLAASPTTNLAEFTSVASIGDRSTTFAVTNVQQNGIPTHTVEDTNTVITLTNPNPDLGDIDTVTDIQFYQEYNLILLSTGEIIGFRDVGLVSANQRTISTLIRGMYGTQHLISLAPTATEAFLLKGEDAFFLNPDIKQVPNTNITFGAYEPPEDLSSSTLATINYTGEDYRPAAPTAQVMQADDGSVGVTIQPATLTYYDGLIHSSYLPPIDPMSYTLEWYDSASNLRFSETNLTGSFAIAASTQTSAFGALFSGGQFRVYCTNLTFNLAGHSTYIQY